MSVALITSIYGDYDELHDPPEQDGVDEYVAVVDRQHDGVSRWRQIIVPSGLHPRLAAKRAKCCPSAYTDADTVLWIDGHAHIRDDTTAWAVSHLTDDQPIVQFIHPERDDLSAEAKVSADLRKYADLPVEAQAAHYKAMEMPDGWGLWAAGIIATRQTSAMKRFGQMWLAEQFSWTYQDQVSEPYVLWRLGLRPATLPGSLWHSEYVRFAGHRSDA